MIRRLNRLWIVLAIEALAIAALLTLALDMRVHATVQELGGVNVWGYRGPVAHQRQPNEVRIAIVGGSRAFGWGEPASALTSHLRRIIMFTTDRPGSPLRPIVVVNLGRLRALPNEYADTLAHYSYLRPDYVCLYDDLGERGTGFDPHESALFRLTGYSLALPLALREKVMAWRFGSVSRGYAARPALGATPNAAGEAPNAYAAQMMTAIAAAHAQARGVVLVLSPAESDAQIARRRALVARLTAAPSWLRVVDLGAHPELRDPAMRIDGWNYGSAGIVRTAELITPALVDLIGR